MENIEMDYQDVTKPDPERQALLLEMDRQYPMKKTQKAALYSIRLGLSKLQDIPLSMRSPQICLEACELHPESFAFITEETKKILPKDRMDQMKAAYQKAVQERAARDDEQQYRTVTGDYNHDGKTDWKDKQLARNGGQDLGID